MDFDGAGHAWVLQAVDVCMFACMHRGICISMKEVPVPIHLTAGPGRPGAVYDSAAAKDAMAIVIATVFVSIDVHKLLKILQLMQCSAPSLHAPQCARRPGAKPHAPFNAGESERWCAPMQLR